MSCKKDEEYILLDMLLYGCTLISVLEWKKGVNALYYCGCFLTQP
ncbi:MAG: hypothetical protein U9P79_08330 [Candidatus Cloacimonadota bacterium]|nr:hypothetical protein [Candidatus Cloacimonadota bacterium]